MKPIATLDKSLGTIAKFVRLMSEAGLPDETYQHVIDHPDARRMLVGYCLGLLEPKSTTEVVYAGVKPWLSPKPIVEQIDILAQEFSLSLGKRSEWMEKVASKIALPLPQGCYWAAFPSRRVMLQYAHTTFALFGDVHAAITDLVLTSLGKKVQLEWDNEQILAHRLKIAQRTAYALDLLEQEQPGDIWILPCQLGWKNVGKLGEHVRSDFCPLEFGLPAWMVGVQLSIHHAQISNTICPFIECAGDRFRDDLTHAPLFYCGTDRVEFACWSGSAYDYCGSASAFLPQVSLDHVRV